MKLIIGGSLALIISFCGFSAFFPAFLNLVAGILPVMLIAGGCLALYIHYETKCECCDKEDDSCKDSAGKEVEPTDSLKEEKKPEPEQEKSGQEEEKTTPGEEKSEPDEEKTRREVEAGVPDSEADTGPGENQDAAGSKLLGNDETHVFHRSDCKYSQSKKCTVFFESRDVAIEKGYKPCGVCKP